MMFWIEFVVLLAIIFWGIKVGGVFLTLAGGIGVFIFTFIFRAPIADPPLVVLRIILCVVLAGGAMQAAGGIEYLVALAEKILRKHPKSITILAPVVSWVFVFCCGTGHIIWSLLPIINEIAVENDVRPERPIAASIVSSQNAICGTPLSAATAALIGFLAEYADINLMNLLLVTIPATLCGSVAAGIFMYKKGKELADDPEFRRRIAAGSFTREETEGVEKKEIDFSLFSKGAKLSVGIFIAGMVVIVLLGTIPALRPVLADGTTLGMTDIIQVFMLIAAAIICLTMDAKPEDIMKTQVFQSGVFAAVVVIGLCWVVNIFIGAQASYLTDVISKFTDQFPWIFIIACYLVANITTSQGSTTAIVIPLGIALGISVPVLVSGWALVGSHFLIPAASETLAAPSFDTAGTTKVMSFTLPSIVMALVDCGVAFLLGSIIL